MIIYKTTCLVNNKIYIGQDKNNRSSYLGSGTKILDCIKSYGKENFKKEILHHCACQMSLDYWEGFYIRLYKSCDENIGYNILTGTANGFGSGSPMLNTKTKEQVRESLISFHKNNPGISKKWSSWRKNIKTERPELHKFLSDFGKTLVGDKNPNYGNRWDEEKKLNMRNKLSDGRRKGENNANFGNKWNEDQRKNLSKKKRKFLIMFDWENLKVKKVWKGSGHVQKEFNIESRGSVTGCAGLFKKLSIDDLIRRKPKSMSFGWFYLYSENVTKFKELRKIFNENSKN